MSDADAAVRIENLDLAFDGRPLLDNFCLEVGQGEKVTIIGPSGCGKSSLLRCILGFVAPCAGSISVQGDALTTDSVWEQRRRLAYVPQEPEPGQGTVAEILKRPFLYQANRHLSFDHNHITALFEALALEPALLNKLIVDLSGGEKQRVTLIGALLLKRDILLLDEPVSALDPDAASRVATQLLQRKDLTVLAVCHQPGDLGLGGRVIHLKEHTAR